jgi:hypothetical protein
VRGNYRTGRSRHQEETPLRINISSLLREAGSDDSANTLALDTLWPGASGQWADHSTPR